MRLLLAVTLAVSAAVVAAQQTTDPDALRKQQEAAAAAAAKQQADREAMARRAAEDALRRAQGEAAQSSPEQRQQVSCLHGPNETAEQRARVQSAVYLARQINTAEAFLHRDRRAYVPLASLTNVGPPADGFVVTLTTDGSTYAFAIKDTLDACKFALFSDQNGLIYNATPMQ